jgi:hypothetical protein
MAKPKQTVKQLKDEISKLNLILHELNKKYTFKHVKGRAVLIVQIGDPATGWIGDPESVAFLIRELKQAGVDETHNIIIYHYAAKFQVLAGDRLWP